MIGSGSASGVKRRLPDGLARERTVVLREKLVELYAEKGSDFLSDPTRVWELTQPTTNFNRNGQPLYKYVGRERAEVVLNRIQNLGSRHLQVLGARGTGKSTVVSTIAGYLIGSGQKVVYLCGEQFHTDPVFVLLEALLVAYGTTDSLVELAAQGPTVDQLIVWVRSQPEGSLLFVVDEWDTFENQDQSRLQNAIERACMTHALVKVSSVNSRSRRIWSPSDKADDEIETVFFDGPFTSSELDTWLGQSGLTAEKLEDVVRLTGGTPRLLRFYEECEGDETKLLRRIRGVYKLFDRFIGKLKTQKQLRAAMDLIVAGQLSRELPEVTDFSCFYMDEEETFHPLSPFLRSQAEYFLMEQHSNLNSTLLYNDILSWVQVVTLDCEATAGRDPARIGWNVEALVISVIRYQKKIFDKPFKHYKTVHDGEMAALKALTKLECEEGVLLGPLAFNEKALDLVWIRLMGGVLSTFAVQITVAQWKAKAKSESHKVWKETILPKWTLKSYTRAHEFCYVMPEKVMLKDVPGTSFKRLADVHECLEGFDDLLDLKEPSKLQRTTLVQCSGVTATGVACKNSARVSGAYHCRYHTPST